MTFVGKLFLMINLALSLLMALVALAMYTNGIDWSDNRAKGSQPPGRLADKLEEVRHLIAAIGPVENTWRAARADLLQREEQRREDHDWYAGELDHLRTKATAARPGRTTVLDKHLPVRDPRNKNRPQMDPTVDRAGQPLLALTEYGRQLDAARRDNLNVLDELKKEIAEDVRLTNLITGVPGKKGLRQLLTEERDKRDGIVAEVDLTRPLFINTVVESELVKKRHEALQERITELKDRLRRKDKVDVTRRGS
jgi:hypothetical protein